MLDADDNRMLTQVGPGTLMGGLLRRYWMPIASVAELEAKPVRAVRVLGEDLTLYRDRGGRYGLVARRCAHRCADLSMGIVEEHGLRCSYHGWLFDEGGRCTEQPFEQITHPSSRFRERASIASYPVEARAGLLWAWLGPQPAPLVPDWDQFHAPGYKQILFAEVPCNWFQCQENAIDPVHFEWLHGKYTRYLGKLGPRARPHVKIAFEEFEHGFTYKRLLEGEPEDSELWTIGRVCLWPNALYTGAFEWHVPIDDEKTLMIFWVTVPLPEGASHEQATIPSWWIPIRDARGELIVDNPLNQDIAAWVGQGTITDRSQEHLGESDRGLIMMRRRMLEQARLVADGGEPKSTFRDPATNQKVFLPLVGREIRGTRRPPQFHLPGQPAEVRAEIDALWRAHEAATKG